MQKNVSQNVKEKTMAKTLAEGRKPTTRTYYPTISQGRNRIMDSKTLKVLQHLEKHGEITSWDAIRLYQATRLSGIIWFLRKEGHNITTSISSGKSKYATYKLVA